MSGDEVFQLFWRFAWINWFFKSTLNKRKVGKRTVVLLIFSDNRVWLRIINGIFIFCGFYKFRVLYRMIVWFRYFANKRFSAEWIFLMCIIRKRFCYTIIFEICVYFFKLKFKFYHGGFHRLVKWFVNFLKISNFWCFFKILSVHLIFFCAIIRVFGNIFFQWFFRNIVFQWFFRNIFFECFFEFLHVLWLNVSFE